MVTREDLESYLIRMDLEWNEVDEGMFLVQSQSGGVVVHLSDPVLLVRLKVMDLPNGESDLTGLYRTLLELNATDIVHGAYGIEDGELILTDTLELQTLDFEELQASVESLQFAASSHLERIKVLAGANDVSSAAEDGSADGGAADGGAADDDGAADDGSAEGED